MEDQSHSLETIISGPQKADDKPETSGSSSSSSTLPAASPLNQNSQNDYADDNDDEAAEVQALLALVGSSSSPSCSSTTKAPCFQTSMPLTKPPLAVWQERHDQAWAALEQDVRKRWVR